MNIAKNKLDINEIIECIERNEQQQREQEQEQIQSDNNISSQNASSPYHHEVEISEMVQIEIDYNMIVEEKKDYDDIKSEPEEAPPISYKFKKMDDFDNQLSSIAFGNELVMDDIINQMDNGDDGQNNDHETPMGPTPTGTNADDDDDSNSDVLIKVTRKKK